MASLVPAAGFNGPAPWYRPRAPASAASPPNLTNCFYYCYQISPKQEEKNVALHQFLDYDALQQS